MKASEICTSNGKKTLNIDHIIEALKEIKFDNHIRKLQCELDFSALENEENNLIKKESVTNLEDSVGMKDLINKKRKNKKEKKNFEFTEDLLNEQMKLFEKSKMQNMQSHLTKTGINGNGSLNNLKNGEDYLLKENSKKLKLENMEKNLFAEERNNEEEQDFD